MTAERVRGGGRGTGRMAGLLLAGALVLGGIGGCTLVGMPPGAGSPGAAGGATGDGTLGPSSVGDGQGPGVGDASADRKPPAGPRTRGTDEVRALWVVRTALAHPDSVRLMVERADRAGFNTLLVQVRGRGDAFYRSRREPRSEILSDAPPTYDPLELVLEEAHRRGLGVHAWVNVHLVHGVGDLPESPRHLVRSSPELLAVPRELAGELDAVDPYEPSYVATLLRWARRNQDRIEGLYTSPSNPAVKRHVEGVLRDLLARYPVDGVHLDYLRYGSPDFDYSPGALSAFRAWASPRIPESVQRDLDRRGETDPTVWPDGLPELWDEFRRQEVTDLMRRTESTVRAVRPDAVLSAAVRADPVDARDHRFQDWAAWLEAGWVDAVAPMAYTESESLFRSWVDDAVRRAGRDRVWAGIGVYKTDLPGTLEQIRIARSTGVAGVALFSYDWAVAEAPTDRRGTPFLDRVGAAAFGAPLSSE